MTRPTSAEDRIVNVLSHWLARHVGDDDVRRELESVAPEELLPRQAEAVEELRSELRAPGRPRGHLEMVVRETMEALALGD